MSSLKIKFEFFLKIEKETNKFIKIKVDKKKISLKNLFT
jgi:hypothetical protein